MTPLMNSYRLIITCAGILLAGCTSTHNQSTYDGTLPWQGLKSSIRAPSRALKPDMSIRCVVLERKLFKLKEGLHDWEKVEELRDRIGGEVLAKAACVLEGLNEGEVESGYYLTSNNAEEWPKSFHGLRLKAREVRIEGEELSFKAALSYGCRLADVLTQDDSRGLRIFPIMSYYDKTIRIRMRSNQVQVVDIDLTGRYVALLEVIDH